MIGPLGVMPITPVPDPAPGVSAPVTSNAAGDCILNGTTVKNGQSQQFYFTSAATAASGCATEQRACSNGKLAGTANFVTCTPEPAGGIELITDVGVKMGFAETDACPDVSQQPFVGGCAKPGMRNVVNPFGGQPAGTLPLWTLGQWGSRSSAPGGAGVLYGDGRQWGNADKYIALFPSGIIEMGMNAFSEFGGVYRQVSGRPGFPSLYLNFPITAPAPKPLGSGPISTMKNLYFSMQARLVNANRHQQPGYDPGLNAASFIVYLGLQNLNMASPSYGEYVWFGLPVYDDRDPSPAAYQATDDFGDGLGTHMFIYSLAYSQLAQTSVQSGQLVTLQRDLAGDVKTAIATGVARGYLKNSNMADYRISGATIGWEVPGLNEVALQFRTPSLKVKH